MKAEAVFSVAGKVAFVTGGAAGLGQAMVQVLLANGAHVALFDSDAAALSDMVRRSGPDIMPHLGDVTDAEAVDAAVLATVGRFGALDICIANAGISDPTPGLLHECTSADWATVVDVNLNGLFYTCRAALTQMQRQRRGKIITVASMWGLMAPAGVFLRPAYAASKGAVVNLTREMALHYADKGIQVNALCPGIFQTATRPRDPAAAIAYTPMGRLGQMTDIAGATLFLASGASNFMTGQTLVIDGGVLAR
jgi:NAD(P)-dependent dehydrogenase (short-subunit alcohol dehydrogenase family)